MDYSYEFRAKDGSECRIAVKHNPAAVVIYWPAGMQDFPDVEPASIDTLELALGRARTKVEQAGFRLVCQHCGNFPEG